MGPPAISTLPMPAMRKLCNDPATGVCVPLGDVPAASAKIATAGKAAGIEREIALKREVIDNRPIAAAAAGNLQVIRGQS